MSGVRFATIMLLTATFLRCEEFSLWFVGLGPISMRAEIAVAPGGTRRLVAHAANDLGQSIENARFCLLDAAGKQCVFEFWNTGEWKSGTGLDWNLDLPDRTPASPLHAKIISLDLTADRADPTIAEWLKKSRETSWSFGRVIDTKRAVYLVGIAQTSRTTGSVSATTNQMGRLSETTGTAHSETTSTATPIYAVSGDYAIETEQFVYFVSETALFRWSKLAHLAVDGLVLVHEHGDKLTILDRNQKKHEASIIRQIEKVDTHPATQSPVVPDARADSPNGTLTNDDVLSLKVAGFGDDFVIAKIKISRTAFQLATADLIRLKQSGLSEVVISTMVQVSSPK